MNRSRWAVAAAAAAVGLSACAPPAPPAGVHHHERLQRIRTGLSLRTSDPARAAAELERAGPGLVLEPLRWRLWVRSLEAARAAPSAWQRLLDAGPPDQLAARALLGYAVALQDAGEPAATAALEQAAAAGAEAADELLVTSSVDSPERRRALLRMVVERPERLRRLDPAADSALRRRLSEDERLRRARALIDRGQAMLAVRELTSDRYAGRAEVERQWTLAEAHLVRGAAQQAVRSLPARLADDPQIALVAARARRRLAWQRYPRSGTVSAFRRALAAAERALAVQQRPDGRQTALELVVEMAVEVRSLERAWWAWRELRTLQAHSDPDEWLGRRLGVALAVAGDGERSRQLALELKGQRRCLTFWSARVRDDQTALAELASAPVPDLYGRWARSGSVLAPTLSIGKRPAEPPGEPPPAVQLLLEWGETELALAEWRWQAEVRGVLPDRALALARLEEANGRRVRAIRSLRMGWAELGSVWLDRVPVNVRDAYLPLPYARAVIEAAQRAGVEPWLVSGVARQESAFVAGARSSAGAVGVMQLMEGTARPVARALGWSSFDLSDPRQNLRLGAAELARLLERYDGALEPALAAYNAGPNRVDRWWRQHRSVEEFTEAIPIRETYGYVRSVVYLAEAYRVVYRETWNGGLS